MFNYEGGCYAKVINLSPEGEPDIYRTTQMFGTILENVVLDELTRKVKFEDQSITENTRASYPLHYIPNYVQSGRGGHPKNIVFLTADAFGVLPPIAKLTREQAMYYFLSGYTAKVAGTERGVKEPQATFSSCFGAVFLVWHPTKYAEMLGKLIDEHGSDVWLVNTGWTGGAFGVGKRMKLSHTRAMVHALLRGDLHSAPARHRSDLRAARAEACRRRPERRAQSAQHVVGQGRVRRAGEEARRRCSGRTSPSSRSSFLSRSATRGRPRADGGARGWNGGTVERWKAGGTVERWNGGTVNGGTQATIPLVVVQVKGFGRWFFVSVVVVLARFRAFLRVVILQEFQPDSARISWEQIKKTTRENARKPANVFLNGLIRGHPPHPR